MAQLDMVRPDVSLYQRVSEFLGHEAALIDDRDWHEWLALFSRDAQFWVPAWLDDHKFTSDPARQTSLIYADMHDLEARVFRVESEDSYASMPLPQTSHLVTCTGASEERGLIKARANWLVHFFWRTKGAFVRAGRYEYELRDTEDGLRIKLKKVFVHDDRVISPVDFYNI
ncbi:MAG: nuclear transport factor 2 family protein [Rhizobiales bacterium]|nr:nuclear transport factor 2 family protein [Hyphomicrobiales bacterium]